MSEVGQNSEIAHCEQMFSAVHPTTDIAQQQSACPFGADFVAEVR